MEDGGGSSHHGRERSDEKWFSSGYSLKMEPTKFSEELNAGCVRKTEIKDDTVILDLSKWKDKIAIHWDGEAGG